MKYSIATFLFILLNLTISAQEIKWISFEEAVKQHKENPKPILVDVYTDWCGFCKKMDKYTYSNSVIINYINSNFYAVKLDGEGKKDITFNDYTFKFKNEGRRGYHEFAAALLDGKLSYPTTVFLNEKLELLDRVPGYLDTNTMEKVINFFGSKKFETESWADFEKNFQSRLN